MPPNQPSVSPSASPDSKFVRRARDLIYGVLLGTAIEGAAIATNVEGRVSRGAKPDSSLVQIPEVKKEEMITLSDLSASDYARLKRWQADYEAMPTKEAVSNKLKEMYPDMPDSWYDEVSGKLHKHHERVAALKMDESGQLPKSELSKVLAYKIHLPDDSSSWGETLEGFLNSGRVTDWQDLSPLSLKPIASK